MKIYISIGIAPIAHLWYIFSLFTVNNELMIFLCFSTSLASHRKGKSYLVCLYFLPMLNFINRAPRKKSMFHLGTTLAVLPPGLCFFSLEKQDIMVKWWILKDPHSYLSRFDHKGDEKFDNIQHQCATTWPSPLQKWLFNPWLDPFLEERLCSHLVLSM